MGLVFTLAALLLAIGGIMANVYQQRIAGSTQERELAFQAAEAALRDAEMSLMCRVYVPKSNTLGQCVAGPGSPATPACLPGCGSGPASKRFALGFQPFEPAATPLTKGKCPNGLCTPLDTQSTPTWKDVKWESPASTTGGSTTASPGISTSGTVPIGYFTAHPNFATQDVVPGITASRQPRFLIEAVPAVCDPAVRFCTYRITATGWGNASNTSATGSKPATTVTLQELFRPW